MSRQIRIGMLLSAVAIIVSASSVQAQYRGRGNAGGFSRGGGNYGGSYGGNRYSNGGYNYGGGYYGGNQPYFGGQSYRGGNYGPQFGISIGSRGYNSNQGYGYGQSYYGQNYYGQANAIGNQMPMSTSGYIIDSSPIMPTVNQASYTTPAAPEKARMVVTVPTAETRVTIDGVATKQDGIERLFETPLLEAGRSFTYTLEATWMDGGKEQTRKKEVEVQAGRDSRVDFRDAELITKP